MTRTRIVIAAIGLLLIAITIVLARAGSGASSAARPAAPAVNNSRGVAMTAAIARPSTTVELGEMRRYALHLDTRADLDPEGGSGAQLGLDLRGSWIVTLARRDGDQRIYEARVDAPVIELPGAGGEYDPAAIVRAVAQPHYLVLDATGRVQELLVPADTDATTWRVWFGIASAAQVRAGPGEEWTAEELDASGEYVAEYRRNGDRLEKRKLRYLRVRADGGWIERDAAALGLDGALSIAPDDGDWPRSVDGYEEAWTEDQKAVVGVRVRTEISLALIDTGRDEDAADRLAADRHSLRGGDLAPASAATGAVQTVQSVRELVALLAAGEIEPSLLIERFAATFAENPGAVAEALALVREDPDRDASAVIAAALGAEGSPEAQAALIELAGDESLGSRYPLEALIELGRTRQPTDAALATLRAAMDEASADRSGTAALALGNAADALSRTQPDAAAELVADLAARLEGAGDDAEAVTLMAALGNTAVAAAAAPLTAQLASVSPTRRAAAAESLRLIPGEVEPPLAGTLAGDPHPAVRARAAFALGYRPLPAALAPLTDAAKHDREAVVRMEAVASLAASGRGDSQATDTITWVATHDPDPAVRRAAAEYL